MYDNIKKDPFIALCMCIVCADVNCHQPHCELSFLVKE